MNVSLTRELEKYVRRKVPRFSLVNMAGTQDFLEKQLGRNVDVVTREGLDPAIRDRVLREAERAF
jgi:predicted nucleotidyltransferase